MEIEQHLKLAEGIRSLFSGNEGKPLKIEQVLQQLGDRTRGVFTSAAEMRKLIQTLAQIIPDWIMVAQLPAGTFIKQRRLIESYAMREKITAFFEKH